MVKVTVTYFYCLDQRNHILAVRKALLDHSLLPPVPAVPKDGYTSYVYSSAAGDFVKQNNS